MKLKNAALAAPLVAALLCSLGWAQLATNTADPTATSTKGAKNTPKEKHWNGSLVDISCMAKALASVNAVSPQAAPAAGASHFAGGGAAPLPGGQAPGGLPQSMGVGQGGGAPGPPSRDTGVPGDTSNTDANAADRARSLQAIRVDNAAKTCPASPSTESLGLATSDGQVVQFDADGNAKAKEALKGADVQPGKKVKAKVTGIMEDQSTVKVAAIDVKGKGK